MAFVNVTQPFGICPVAHGCVQAPYLIVDQSPAVQDFSVSWVQTHCLVKVFQRLLIFT